MPGRLTSSHFVGREAELAELELAARDAADGRPGVVVIGGDSGVGKTRLIAELAGRIAADATVLRGEAIEQGDAELPYAPLLGALRPLVRGDDPALGELSDGGRAQLAGLLPALGDADRASGAAPSRREIDGAVAGQLQLFEALLELLEVVSRRMPLVLVIEDVHWAERSTRAFLAFLAANLRTERILVVLSYRTDELHRRHPLLGLLTDLDRLAGVRRLTLVPFDRRELAEALTDILGTAPEAALLDRLLVRSEGNPLYVEELLAAGLDGRGAPPQSLSDAIMLRIERLSADAQAVTRVIAAAVRASEGLIAAVSGIEGPALHAALREALAEHVLAADGDRFRFRHALLREAVYDDLLPGERSALHLALAQALEAVGEGALDEEEVERTGQVAGHYAAAGDQPAAIVATFAAAETASRVRAYADAAQLGERALELWGRVPDAAELLGFDEARLLEHTADAHFLSDNRARREQLLRRAVELVDPDVDPRRHGALLAELARSYWSLNRGAEALELAERALTLIPPGAGDVDRALVQSWLARTRFLRGRFREAGSDAEAALAVGRAQGDPCVISGSLNTLGMANISVGEVDLGVTQLREAIDVAAAAGDDAELASAYVNLADLLMLAGRTDAALDVITEGVSRRMDGNRRGHSYLELTQSLLAFDAGRWETAVGQTGPPRKRLQGTTRILGLMRDAEIAVGTGDHASAAAALAAAEPLVRVSSEAQWHGQLGSLLGELHRRGGDLVAAQQAVAAALDELELCTDDVMRIARVSAVGAAVEADRAVRARDVHDPDAERDAVARAEIHLSRLAAAGAEGGPVERAWRAFGSAELSRAHGASDPLLWAAGAEAFDAVGRPYPAAAARWRQAEALVESGDRDAAGLVAAVALAVVRRLGAGWLAGELDALVARARLSVPAESAAGTAPEGGPGEPDAAVSGDEPAPFGLTPRELQVLALVAGGATNRQIGAALFMAEKTASVHVSRILAKLGVRSRTQAAAVAHRQHLVALAEPVRSGS